MNERVQVGDNSGAFEPRDVAKDAIDEALRPLWTRFAQLKDSAGRAKADDEETAGKVVDLDGMLQSLQARIDEEHGRVKRPYLEAGSVVDGLANKLRDEIVPIRKALEAMLTAYQTKKLAEIEAARAAEREAEQDDPEPGFVPEQQSARRAAAVRGDYGARSSLRDQDVVVVFDVKKVPKSILENEKVLAAIRSVAKPVLKAGQKVGGCRLESKTKAVTTR